MYIYIYIIKNELQGFGGAAPDNNAGVWGRVAEAPNKNKIKQINPVGGLRGESPQ